MDFIGDKNLLGSNLNGTLSGLQANNLVGERGKEKHGAKAGGL